MKKEESKTYYLFGSLGLITLHLPLFPEHLYAEEIRLYLSFQATLKSSCHSTTITRHEGGVEGETGMIQRQKKPQIKLMVCQQVTGLRIIEIEICS